MLPDSAIPLFLTQVQRRSVLASLLAASFAAAGLNEAFRWAAIGAILLWKLRVPVLDVGPLVVVVLVPYLLRRWTPAAAARRADARLGLSDRLGSFVDFMGREDVPGEVRDAQARETERALAAARPAAAVPIRGWLAAGPLLLLASLTYPLFFFTGMETTTTLMLSWIAPGGNRGGGGGGQGPIAGAPDQGDGSEGTPQPGAQSRPGLPAGAVSQAKPESEQAATSKPADGARGDGRPAAPQDETEAAHSPDHGNAVEPEQLTSERVGQSLAKVVDPVYNPGEQAPPPPEAAGSVSINLVPRSLPGRTGGVPVEGSAARRVTVDLDALPEQYRPLVKTYFELLAAGDPAEDGATTPSARSAIP